MRQKLLISVLLVGVLLLSGCVGQEGRPTTTTTTTTTTTVPTTTTTTITTTTTTIETKTFHISGIDKEETVSSDVPIILFVSGIRVVVRVEENTVVQELVVSGIDVTVYLPKGSNPEIDDSGIRTRIIRG